MEAQAGFGKARRLLHSGEFKAVFRQGRRYSLPNLTMVFLKRRSQGEQPLGPRLGLSISKKVGSSPQRNQLKRRLREVFRLQAKAFHPMDMVVVGRPESTALDYGGLRQAFLDLCGRAKALKEGA